MDRLLPRHSVLGGAAGAGEGGHDVVDVATQGMAEIREQRKSHKRNKREDQGRLNHRLPFSRYNPVLRSRARTHLKLGSCTFSPRLMPENGFSFCTSWPDTPKEEEPPIH